MSPKDLGQIGILAGGPSSEREISLSSGKAVFNAFKEIGCDVIFLDIRKEDAVKEQLRASGIDLAFIALHGRFGEDGTIQTILEGMNIPYTGSGPSASRLALDKIVSKEIFAKNGIDIPAYNILDKKLFDEVRLKSIIQDIGLPLIVKPQFEGSSIGISIVRDNKGMKKAIESAFTYGDQIIIERYIEGRDITVGMLDGEPLPVIEIIAQEQFYNFNAKYKSKKTQYVIPARISESDYKTAQVKGKLAHRLLGCGFFSRVDMILDEVRKRILVLEVNSIPGLTNHSLLPKAAACAGITFNQLCLKIAEAALKKVGVNKSG